MKDNKNLKVWNRVDLNPGLQFSLLHKREKYYKRHRHAFDF